MTVKDQVGEQVRKLRSTKGKDIQSAKKALVELGDAAVPELVAILPAVQEVMVRTHIFKVLGQIGGGAVPALIDLVKTSGPVTRADAVDALGLTRDERALPVIEAALQDSEQKVRLSAKAALWEFGIKDTSAIREAKGSSPSSAYPAVASSPVMPDGGPVPMGTPELPAGNLFNGFTVMTWYFLTPSVLKNYIQYWGMDRVRTAAALPISVLVWLVLAVPVIAIALGILPLSSDRETVVLSNVATLIGLTATWFVSQFSPTSRRRTWLNIFFFLFIVSTGCVVWTDLKIVSGLFGQLGLAASGTIVLTYLLAMSIPIGIGTSLDVWVPFMIPLGTGGILGFFIPGVLTIEFGPELTWFGGAAVLSSAVVVALPAFLVRILVTKYGSAPMRITALMVYALLLLAFVWMLLLDGWYFLANGL